MICSLKFRKDLLSLKCCSGFCAFGFEAMSHPSCYLTSIIEKNHHGPVIVLFFCANSAAFLATSEVSLQPIISHWGTYILAIQQII